MNIQTKKVTNNATGRARVNARERVVSQDSYNDAKRFINGREKLNGASPYQFSN